ncbi:Ger(x)C family spore germination protein [Paenibacillus sp. BSR1-1]|uniref:Ger(x)C family spore germination protein n=1 Tax=Paenibacillus sp. BSR1-1 TaxID=3020845 RepID=UPI0025AF0FF2|nr:Ger(x)C family spore germination protein [Paenibacillus sp. BSR1-1]MDN3020059.1 Ger(x)C family spore germination protein [Paenibacillus sp. BSR1-1]
MKKLLYITYALFLLTGCSKINEIQFQAYAVGIGIDYKDDVYHVVMQFLDFSNVAKTEQGKSDKPSPIWLGVGKGKTVEDAIVEVYHSIQIPVNYDQISLFVFGKSLLEHRLGKTINALDTNFNIRQTGRVYGTDQPLDKIFTSQVPFDYPFSNARINQPEYMQQQESAVPAISLQDLIYQFNEKTKTILLPSITVNDESIKQNLDKIPVTTFTGAYLMKDEKMKGLLTNKELEGFIRVNNKAVRSPVTISERENGKNKHVTIELLNPKVKRIMNKDKNEVQVGLDIKISAIVRESDHTILAPRIKREIKEKIRDYVYEAYVNSDNIGGDIYQFEDYMYRFMYDDWIRYQKSGKFPILDKTDIHVKVKPLKSINKINAGIHLPLK